MKKEEIKIIIILAISICLLATILELTMPSRIMVENKKHATVEKFLLDQGVYLGNQYPNEARRVYSYVEISHRRELQKKNAYEFVWIASCGKENSYYRFTDEKPLE